MANYVKLSDLPEGTICKLKLANGTLEEYVLAKHDYESGLNGTGRVLFISRTAAQFNMYPLSCGDSQSEGAETGWGETYSTFYSTEIIRSYLNSSSFKSRFQPTFFNFLKETKVYYNGGINQRGVHGGLFSATCSQLFFIPSAVELGATNEDCVSGDRSTALSKTVRDLILADVNTWTRTMYNDYLITILDDDDGPSASNTLYPYVYGVCNESNTFKRCSSSIKLKSHLCFTLDKSTLIDTDNENVLTFISEYKTTLCSYVSPNGIAQMVDHMFFGINNTAKKIKKAYIGFDNTARLWYKWIASGFSVATILKPDTSNYRTKLAGAAVSGSALFAGGEFFKDTTSGYSSVSKTTLAEIFNENRTTSLAPDLPVAVDFFAGASVGDAAVFGGGWNSSDARSSTVCMYQPNFTQTSLSKLSATIAENSGASTKNYALLAGGTNKTSWGSRQYVSTVYPYSIDGVAQSTTTLYSSCGKPGTATFNGSAIIAGGYTASSAISKVNRINDNLTRTTLSDLDQARGFVAGGASDDLIVFVGGNNKQGGGTFYSTIDAYDSNLTKISIGATILNGNSSYSQIYVGGYVPVETKKCPNGVFIFASVTSRIYIDAKNGTLLEETHSIIEDAGVSAYGYSQYRIYASVCVGQSFFKYGGPASYIDQYTASTD